MVRLAGQTEKRKFAGGIMFEIKKGSGCFYIGESEENPLAEMTYVRSGRKVIIDHTYVPPEMGGQGVGKLLLKELVDMVRAEGKKIVPACPYAKEQMEKNKEYHDLIYKK
jgi:predicted GNAT family acetyltransferase